MSEPTIICPNCTTEIKLTESLAAPLIESTRREYEKRLSEKDEDVAKCDASFREREESLSQAQEALDAQVAEKLKFERSKIVIEEGKKAKLTLQNDLDQKAREVADLNVARTAADESVQVLKEVHERMQAYLALRPRPLKGSDPLFATTVCHDRGGNILTPAGQPLSTRAIHRIITEGLLLAGVKKSGIVIHSLRHSTPTFALLNNANPTRVQKMMRHKHYATTEIYVEEGQQLLEGAEEAVTQI